MYKVIKTIGICLIMVGGIIFGYEGADNYVTYYGETMPLAATLESLFHSVGVAMAGVILYVFAGRFRKSKKR